MEKKRTELLILKKARLLSFIEERLPQIVMKIAMETGYKDKSNEELRYINERASVEDKLGFFYMISGYWHMAMYWLEREPGVSSREMSAIAIKIVKGSKDLE